MTEWFEGSNSFSITTAQTMGTPILIYTQDDDPPRARTIVDGYITVITDTDNLCQIRLFGPLPGFTSAGDLAFATPTIAEASRWYSFDCARGPMVWRIRSKRTFEHLEELWIGGVKLRGGDATALIVGWRFLLSGI